MELFALATAYLYHNPALSIHLSLDGAITEAKRLIKEEFGANADIIITPGLDKYIRVYCPAHKQRIYYIETYIAME